MTLSDLKYHTKDTDPYFFTRSTMKFFGDTMRNYGVRGNTIDGIEVWELHRKKPSGQGLTGSHYFRKDNFEQIYI